MSPSERLKADDAVTILGLRSTCEKVIYDHVFANADREVGGVLVGPASTVAQLPEVSGAISATGATERRASLTFTQQAWAHIHASLEADFPADARIVGWYHSHPGIGIYLSDQDLFIHRNFFALPDQIAVVIDPIARSEGAFAWENDRVARLYEQPTPNAWSPGGQP